MRPISFRSSLTGARPCKLAATQSRFLMRLILKILVFKQRDLQRATKILDLTKGSRAPW
jgi:hypothetical protein